MPIAHSLHNEEALRNDLMRNDNKTSMEEIDRNNDDELRDGVGISAVKMDLQFSEFGDIWYTKCLMNVDAGIVNIMSEASK